MAIRPAPRPVTAAVKATDWLTWNCHLFWKNKKSQVRKMNNLMMENKTSQQKLRNPIYEWTPTVPKEAILPYLKMLLQFKLNEFKY